MKIGSKLRYWREKKNMTFYRIAQISGIDADYIKKIEESTTDNEPNIKIETLDKLAHALGVPASELLNDSEETMYLTDSERELITAFRCLAAKAQTAFINVIDVVGK